MVEPALLQQSSTQLSSRKAIAGPSVHAQQPHGGGRARHISSSRHTQQMRAAWRMQCSSHNFSLRSGRGSKLKRLASHTF